MSAGEYLELDGKVSRCCDNCGITITVTRPPRPLSSSTGAKARKHLAAELRRQIWWEMLCPECLDYWNAIVRKVGEGGLAGRTKA